MHSIHDQGRGIRSFMPMVAYYNGGRAHTKATQMSGVRTHLLSTELLPKCLWTIWGSINSLVRDTGPTLLRNV